MVSARVMDSSWDEFESHQEAIAFALKFLKYHPGTWVAIYDQLGLFCVL